MVQLVRALALAALFALAWVVTASALETGSGAWVTRDSVLKEGPGRNYDVVGTAPAEIRVRVDRCSVRWCQIHGHGLHGWVPIGNLSFGQYPTNFVGGQKYLGGHGDGTVCFYERRNYAGHSWCADSRSEVRDLLLLHRDNTIASIRISGDASVIVCRDRNFHSFCQTIVRNTASMPKFLDRSVSSYRVY